MWRFILKPILLLLLSFVTFAFVLAGSGETAGVVYVGTVEGKSLFVEITEMKNWTESKIFCEESEMQLASVTTTAQLNLLKSSSIFNTTSIGQWTAGRDAQTLLQFAWDHNGESPNASVINMANKYPVSTCLYYYRGNFYGYICSSPHYTMCEVVHGEY